MPSERSKPSEMTGENAARSKVRSISLATCCNPFCTTTSVTGSIAMMSALSSQRTDRDLEVAERVDPHAVARLDHGGAVELLHDRGPGELGAEAELLAAVDRRVLPAAVEPRSAALRGHRPAGAGG